MRVTYGAGQLAAVGGTGGGGRPFVVSCVACGRPGLTGLTARPCQTSVGNLAGRMADPPGGSIVVHLSNRPARRDRR